MSKVKGQLNHSTNKEKAMERKIVLLEERLRLVEQFVELRFCESFKDFTIRKMLRNLPPQHEDDGEEYESSSDDNSQIPSKSKPKPPPSSSTTQRTTASKRTSAPPSSSKDTSVPTIQRELRVRVVRTSGSTSISSQAQPPSPQSSPSLPLIKNPPPESDDDLDASYDDNISDDDFTTFNPEADDDVEVAQDNLDSDPDYLGGTSSPPAKRGRPSKQMSSSKKRKSSSGTSGGRGRPSKHPANKKECPECHTFWKPEAFEKHVQTHSKERNLPCRFCDKRFIERKHLVEHEKGHNLAKYGKMCRVEGCGQLCLDRSKQLTHERRCIRKKLEGGGQVDEEVLEDVRRRSQNVQLGWPQEEKEVEGTENNEEGVIMEGVVELEMEGTAEFANNAREGDPLEGGFDNF